MNLEPKTEKLGFELRTRNIEKEYTIYWRGELVGFYNEEIDTMVLAHDDCPNIYTCDMKRFEEWCAQDFVDLIEKKKEDNKQDCSSEYPKKTMVLSLQKKVE